MLHGYDPDLSGIEEVDEGSRTLSESDTASTRGFSSDGWSCSSSFTGHSSSHPPNGLNVSGPESDSFFRSEDDGAEASPSTSSTDHGSEYPSPLSLAAKSDRGEHPSLHSIGQSPGIIEITETPPKKLLEKRSCDSIDTIRGPLGADNHTPARPSRQGHASTDSISSWIMADPSDTVDKADSKSHFSLKATASGIFKTIRQRSSFSQSPTPISSETPIIPAIDVEPDSGFSFGQHYLPISTTESTATVAIGTGRRVLIRTEVRHTHQAQVLVGDTWMDASDQL